tara:strand:+ start:3416 stop:3598 length:183 start_codon:yes stop_codon:yes gene_type:complete
MRLEFNDDIVLAGWRAWIVVVPLFPFIFAAAVLALVASVPLVVFGGLAWLGACLLLWKRP